MNWSIAIIVSFVVCGGYAVGLCDRKVGWFGPVLNGLITFFALLDISYAL